MKKDKKLHKATKLRFGMFVDEFGWLYRDFDDVDEFLKEVTEFLKKGFTLGELN